MTHSVLDESHIHLAIRETVANHRADIIREVQAAVAANDLARLIEGGEPKRMTVGK